MRKFRTARDLVNLRQGRNDWYRITNQADQAEIMIYDEIGYFGVTASDFVRDLRAVTTNRITLHLNTPGGEVFDGIAIYNALRQHPASVHVVVDSLAASIGSVIAMSGDRITMARNSQMMIHDGLGMAIGNAADLRELAELLDKTSDNIASIYADRTGKSADHWRALMRDETWLSAEEAVAAGLADEVEPSRRASQENSWDLSVFTNRPSPVSDTAMAPHKTSTENSSWDGPAAVAAMPSDPSTLRYAHAWRNSEGDPELKSSYKFPHHRTKGGPANLAAVRNGLARLSQADIPAEDRDAVERHLRSHLDSAGQSDSLESPAFRLSPDDFRLAVKEAIVSE